MMIRIIAPTEREAIAIVCRYPIWRFDVIATYPVEAGRECLFVCEFPTIK
jgi:hypothetical protein